MCNGERQLLLLPRSPSPLFSRCRNHHMAAQTLRPNTGLPMHKAGHSLATADVVGFQQTGYTGLSKCVSRQETLPSHWCCALIPLHQCAVSLLQLPLVPVSSWSSSATDSFKGSLSIPASHSKEEGASQHSPSLALRHRQLCSKTKCLLRLASN